MEIGIGRNYGGCYLTSTGKRFREEYGECREIPVGNLYYIMLDTASWVNNVIEEECFFYVD